MNNFSTIWKDWKTIQVVYGKSLSEYITTIIDEGETEMFIKVGD